MDRCRGVPGGQALADGATIADGAIRGLLWSRAVLNRKLWLAAVLAGFASSAIGLRAATAVEVHLYPLTGHVRLANPDSTDYQFIYYELNSAANAFENAATNWLSIADNYDVSGNGFIDPVNNWLKSPATSDFLAEASFGGSTSALPAYRSIDLGPIWNAEVVLPNDVEATIVDGSSQSLSMQIRIAMAGDYNFDLSVDAGDYAQWRMALGSTTSPWADGNFDGIVDTADYTVWRNHFGDNISEAGYASAGGGSGGVVGGAVPEPAAIVIGLTAGLAFISMRRRRHR